MPAEGVDAHLRSGEREALDAFVDDARNAVAGLLDGMTDEQARRRLVPSKTSLLSIVKHAAFVERVWSQIAFEGRTRAELGLPDDVEASFDLGDGDTVESVRSAYLAAVQDARAVHAQLGLDDLAMHNRRSPLTLRWILLHLVRELSRHAGHGDILREQILSDDAASQEG